MKKAAFGYILVGLSLGLLIANIYHNIYLAPSTSVELFRSIQNTGDYEEVKKLLAEGDTESFSEEDYEFISNLQNYPHNISQFTLLSYQDTAYLLRTTPGTEKLKIIQVEELPADLQSYFQEMVKD